MSRSLDDREKKIGLIYGTMTGFCSVMRNLQEDYKTCSKNYSEEALALLGKSSDFINSFEAIRTLDSIRRIDDDGINELFALSRQIAELYHLDGNNKQENLCFAELPQNTIRKVIENGKTSYEIKYNRNIPILKFIDNDNTKSSVIDKTKDLYRNFADALGVQDKIGNDEIKEAMLDNKYCFVKEVGWIKQSEYNQHLLGIREIEELSKQEYQYGIFNNLQIAIINHQTDYINSLSEEKANEAVKNKWKELIKKNETTKDNFELKVMYKGLEKKLRVYYRIKGDDSSKIEILCIDALSSVLDRKCPVGSDLKLSPKKAKSSTICMTSSKNPSNNNRYYIPKIFPCNNSNPWHITGISPGNSSSDFGLWKIETDAYQMVNVWEYDYDEELWKQTNEMVRDEGYLIHGGDGSSREPQQFNEIDKLKGSNRYYTTTRGCIRVNNKDVVLLKHIFENNLPIELEVKE